MIPGDMSAELQGPGAPVRPLLHKTLTVLVFLATATAVVFALMMAALLIVLPRALGLETLVIATGSMTPAFNAGDIALVDERVEPGDIQLGNVITYFGPEGVVTTHRVVTIRYQDGQPTFLTKGDGNNSPDDYIVPADALIARAEVRLPYLGWVVEFIKRREVVMAAVLVPAILIVLNELVNVGRILRERPTKGAI